MLTRKQLLATSLVVAALAGAHSAGAQEPQMPIPPGHRGPQANSQSACVGCYTGGYEISYGCANGCGASHFADDGPNVGCGCGDRGCFDCGCCLEDDCLIAYTRFDIMYMRRDRPRNVPLTSEGVGGDIVLETNDLPNSDWEAMPRFSVGVPISHCSLIEGVYFGTPTWESEASVTSATGNLYSIYDDFGNFFDGPPFSESTLQFIQYKSMLHNAEGNFLYLLPDPWCGTQVMLLTGFRYVNIREIFRYQTQTTIDDASQLNTIQTYNDLLTWQLGCRIDAQIHGRLRMLLEGKAGLAVNWSRQQTDFAPSADAGIDPFAFGASDDDLALITDLGLTLVYDICPWMSLRGGYHLMYVDGLALAPENLASPPPLPFDFNNIVPEIDTSGAIFYQGATAGLEVRW